ncbi:MAG: hypothetical protein M3071_21330 [Actinomycetota bacterium]|nr:hypothetical protein [Actinomycetota bacterium]
MAIPDGVTVWSSGGGTIVDGMLEWDMASLPAGSTAGLNVTFKVDSLTSGAIAIWAVASALGIVDPVYDNNFASQPVAFNPPAHTRAVHVVEASTDPFNTGSAALTAQLERVQAAAHAEGSKAKKAKHQSKRKHKVKRRVHRALFGVR